MYNIMCMIIRYTLIKLLSYFDILIKIILAIGKDDWPSTVPLIYD